MAPTALLFWIATARPTGKRTTRCWATAALDVAADLLAPFRQSRLLQFMRAATRRGRTNFLYCSVTRAGHRSADGHPERAGPDRVARDPERRRRLEEPPARRQLSGVRQRGSCATRRTLDGERRTPRRIPAHGRSRAAPALDVVVRLDPLGDDSRPRKWRSRSASGEVRVERVGEAARDEAAVQLDRVEGSSGTAAAIRARHRNRPARSGRRARAACAVPDQVRRILEQAFLRQLERQPLGSTFQSDSSSSTFCSMSGSSNWVAGR